MRYKFPLRIPVGRVVSITQGFRDTQLAEWYKSQGLNYPEHMAVDAIAGNSVETYGTPFVCPFPEAKIAGDLNFTQADPVNGISGRVIIEYTDWKNRKILLGGIHLSGAVYQKTYKEGDVLGYIGNYGYVRPEPSIARPFDGSHIHMTLVVDGVLTDPLIFFDPSDPYRGYDTGVHFDIPAIQWAIAKIQEWMRKLGFGAPARIGYAPDECQCFGAGR